MCNWVKQMKAGPLKMKTKQEVEREMAQGLRGGGGDSQADREAKKSPYRSFTQVNDRHLPSIRQMIKDNPVAGQIFMFLVEHMEYRTGGVVASQELLQKVTDSSRTTVYRAVKYLIDKQFIGKGKVGTANVYYINAAIAWHSYGKNHHFAVMNAAVLLDPEENPQLKTSQEKMSVVEERQEEMFR